MKPKYDYKLPFCTVLIMPKKVLQIAYDPGLLSVRRSLMEASGYEVATVVGTADLPNLGLLALAIDLIVVDHSADFEARWGVVRGLKLRYPELPVIALRRDEHEEGISLADHTPSAHNPTTWLGSIALALL
jgi:hypothetical protein